jgi:hypothetical protein
MDMLGSIVRDKPLLIGCVLCANNVLDSRTVVLGTTAVYLVILAQTLLAGCLLSQAQAAVHHNSSLIVMPHCNGAPKVLQCSSAYLAVTVVHLSASTNVQCTLAPKTEQHQQPSACHVLTNRSLTQNHLSNSS